MADLTEAQAALNIQNVGQKSVSGTLVDPLSTIELDLTDGDISAVAIQASGTAGQGDSSVEWQGTVDGTNWVAIPGMSLLNLDGLFHYGPTNGDDIYLFQTVGFQKVRARTGGSPINMDITITGSSGATVITGLQHYTFVKQAGGHVFTIGAHVFDGAPTPDEFGNVSLQTDTNGSLKVTGTVSLPTGASTLAEQQTQTAALQVLDDWDESDRAKVNPIVGQAGVQGGAGAVSATTQRVVIATDQTVIPIRAYSGTCTHSSATATNSSSQALAANANRRYLLIQNHSSASIWINFGGTAAAAAPSIMIGVNQTFVQEGNFVSTQAINVIRTGILDLTFSIIEGT